jgi:putative oxidoreductase
MKKRDIAGMISRRPVLAVVRERVVGKPHDRRMEMGSFMANLDRFAPVVLSLLRIMSGLLFLSAGLQKWFAFPAANPAFANIKLTSLIGIAGIIEIVGGALVSAGLFTRCAAFVMSGEMAVAYFLNRPARGFAPVVNGGTLEVMFCFVFLYLVFAGAGPWSLDAILRKKR